MFKFKRHSLLRRVIADPSQISKIDIPDDQFVLDAIKANYKTIWYVDNPTSYLVEQAIQVNVLALRDLPPQPHSTNLFAVMHDPRSLKYITNPDQHVQLAAVGRNGLMVGVIDNPSPAVQMAAVTDVPDAILRIKNPILEAQLTAIAANYRLIKEMKTAHVDAILLAIKSYIDLGNRRTTTRVLKSNFDLDLRHLDITEKDWWSIVQVYPECHEMMKLTDEQRTYAILCS